MVSGSRTVAAERAPLVLGRCTQQNREPWPVEVEAPVKSERVFLYLAIAQLLHSVEEYLHRLWEPFPPARTLSGLVSSDLETGFLVINVSVVVAAFASYLGPIRGEWRSARGVAWFWVCLELINGIGHPAWSVMSGAYTPGLVTSLLLLPLAAALAWRLVGQPASTS